MFLISRFSLDRTGLKGEISKFNVRFGSEADIARCPRCVRFPLDNGHCSDELARLLSANSGTLSFDHRIGAQEHCMVRLQPQRFRRAVDANPT